jgi:hypothetical protein
MQIYISSSLYPSVNIGVDGELYPVGHPRIMISDFIDIKDVFGLVYARIRPPDKYVRTYSKGNL